MRFSTTALSARTRPPGSRCPTALSTAPEAKTFFDQLSFSHQSAYVLWIESAKKEETRQRRVADAVEMLGEGRRQR